mmetsp:Transcript_9163/g.18749  ORF Transcript_9163/g.18749 Transcript_9163/m.18749 type:complete len:443 (+) Transcript_9163:71-1399(+)
MANNAGNARGGGGGGGGGGQQGSMNEHVEFTVKAEEDLYLTGTENTIRRVTAETNYSCLMLKTQRFSSLFRHYAKYHGLRKDDLEYYFVNPLENEDTPESVQLQRGDTIMVRKRRKPEPPEPAADDEEYFRDMRELLEDDEHMDCVFLVHEDGGQSHLTSPKPVGPTSMSMSSSSFGGMTPVAGSGGDVGGGIAAMQTDDVISGTGGGGASHANVDDGSKKSRSVEDEEEPRMVELRAHKCILTARAEYFKALFRKGATSTSSSGETTHVAFRESTENTIRVEPSFSPKIVRLMLEFIYTNRISALSHNRVSTDELLSLLHLSDRWLLRDLKRLVEHELIRSHMDVNTVPRMYCATEDFHARRLSRACIDFIMENIREVAGNAAFQEEMKHYPHLTLPILKAAADMIPQPAPKRARTEPPATPSGGGGGGMRGSSPIADDSG